MRLFRKMQAALKPIVRSTRFEAVIAVVIFSNSFTLGIEAEILIGNMKDWKVLIEILDHFFTTIFTLELMMRMCVDGWSSYIPGTGRWKNFLDLILLLVTGILTVWILPLIYGEDMASQALRPFMMLRAIRLIRLVRVVQRVPLFREVWLLLRGFTQSFSVLLWTVTVICFVTYVFAIFGVVLISVDVKRGDDHPEFVCQQLSEIELEEIWSETGGVMSWMFTLVQVLTLDSWNSILRPLLRCSPGSWLLFYLYIAVAVILLLNLVTAIIVENAFKSGRIDEEELVKRAEQERSTQFDKLRNLFCQLDGDGSGEVSWEEFEAGCNKPEIKFQLQKLDFFEADLQPLFKLLDTGDGVLSLEEFFEGIQKIRGPAMAKESFCMAKRLEHLIALVEEHSKVLGVLLEHNPGVLGAAGSALGGDGGDIIRLSSFPRMARVHSQSSSASSRGKKQERVASTFPLGASMRCGQSGAPLQERKDDPSINCLGEVAKKIDKLTEDFHLHICEYTQEMVAQCLEKTNAATASEHTLRSAANEEIAQCLDKTSAAAAAEHATKSATNDEASSRCRLEFGSTWRHRLAPPVTPLPKLKMDKTLVERENTTLSVGALDDNEPPPEPCGVFAFSKREERHRG